MANYDISLFLLLWNYLNKLQHNARWFTQLNFIAFLNSLVARQLVGVKEWLNHSKKIFKQMFYHDFVLFLPWKALPFIAYLNPCYVVSGNYQIYTNFEFFCFCVLNCRVAVGLDLANLGSFDIFSYENLSEQGWRLRILVPVSHTAFQVKT